MITKADFESVENEIAQDAVQDPEAIDQAYAKALGLVIEFAVARGCAVDGPSLSDRTRTLLQRGVIDHSVHNFASTLEIQYRLYQGKERKEHAQSEKLFEGMDRLISTLSEAMNAGPGSRVVSVKDQTTMGVVRELIASEHGFVLKPSNHLLFHECQPGELVYRSISGFDTELYRCPEPGMPRRAIIVRTHQMVLNNDIDGIFRAMIAAILSLQPTQSRAA